MEEGPNSMKRPVREEQPGPPLSQRTTGSFLGSLRDSKNPNELVYQIAQSGEHTVEQVLILLVVIQITGILLDSVDSEHAWVDLLGPQAVRGQVAVNLAMLVAVSALNPHALDVSAASNGIPLVVGLLAVWLWHAEEVGSVKSIGEHHRDVVPDLTSFLRQAIEGLCKVGEGLGDFLEQRVLSWRFWSVERSHGLLQRSNGRQGRRRPEKGE
jgi:hypothetical protein